ncbi:hypothetical protein HYQ46_013438 [Verticillium longisporum]|nr:hypothetical protein HYQ46_013438 [Verticillium longisporum]
MEGQTIARHLTAEDIVIGGEPPPAESIGR